MGNEAHRVSKIFSDAEMSHLRYLTEQNAAWSALKAPAFDAMKSLLNKSPAERMLEDLTHREALMRAAIGPLEDLRRAGFFDHQSILARDLEKINARITDRFSFPDISETSRLINEFKVSPGIEALKRYADVGITAFESALHSMRSPWLDDQDAMRSIGSLAALEGIGRGLENRPTFGSELSSALRSDLGDWRDIIAWPSEIFADFGARTEFYVGLGFNSKLADFPAPAFQEILNITGLQRDPPPLVNVYDSPSNSSEDDDDELLERTNKAHSWLLRLETQLRCFIDQEMTKAFGSNWPRHRLPNGLYDEWVQKKNRSEQGRTNRDMPLIAYADFTDYVKVICKRDNWVVFSKFFTRQEDLRESFQRLHPIRLDTMHARPITQHDELLLYVEANRLMRVFVIKPL